MNMDDRVSFCRSCPWWDEGFIFRCAVCDNKAKHCSRDQWIEHCTDIMKETDDPYYLHYIAYCFRNTSYSSPVVARLNFDQFVTPYLSEKTAGMLILEDFLKRSYS